MELAPDSPESTSPSLLDRVAARNPEGWQRLFDLYRPLICYWCLRAGVCPEDTEDVVQEVFTAVTRDIGGFRRTGRRGCFRSWLRTVTRRRISDFFRRQRGQPCAKGGTDHQQQLLQTPSPPDSSATSELPVEEDALVCNRALELVRAEFEETTWRAVRRVVIDRQRPRDVAKELGMTDAAVYQAKSRVLRRLRQELRDLEDFA